MPPRKSVYRRRLELKLRGFIHAKEGPDAADPMQRAQDALGPQRVHERQRSVGAQTQVIYSLWFVSL
jgi:hypothetical protein